MPVLKNARHEAFTQELAKGKTADEAYLNAGFKPNRGNAARLKANECIQKRVDEIKSRIAEKAEWTAADRLRMLADIAEKTKAEDPRVAVSAIAEANKMQGSHAPSKHEHSGDISLTVSQEDAEL
ncbi:terminase small subunit [Brucella anthropi]|uniref:terminase small subunit n=1 Tax=Brucella anthropi TaxID=529 RepID=UPI003D9A0204